MWRPRCWSRVHNRSSFKVKLSLFGAALLGTLVLLFATASNTEAQFRGISVPRVPRVSVPRVPRVAVPRTPRIATPKLPKPAVQPRKLTAPVVGSPKKPTLPVPAAASKQIPTATKQPTSQPAALSKPAAAAAPKGDQYGWADCHATGGVWGHSGGSCGHPTFGGTGGGSGQRRLVAIPWFVPIVPTRWVDPLPCPLGFEKVGETFYGGTKCGPIDAGLVAADPGDPRKRKWRPINPPGPGPITCLPATSWMTDTGQKKPMPLAQADPKTINDMVNYLHDVGQIRRAIGKMNADRKEQCFFVIRTKNFLGGRYTTTPLDDRFNTEDKCAVETLYRKYVRPDDKVYAVVHFHPSQPLPGLDDITLADKSWPERGRIPNIVIYGSSCLFYGAPVPE
jgi:hypothetical protein